MFARARDKVRSVWTLLGRLDGTLGHCHERLSEQSERMAAIEGLAGSIAKEQHRQRRVERERRYPVTVHVFGARTLTPVPSGLDNVSSIRRESPICVYAMTVFLCAGGRDRIQIPIQEHVEAGAWLFVSGPAVATHVLVGQDCQLAPYDGTARATVCLLRSELQVGLHLMCELRSTIERPED